MQADKLREACDRNYVGAFAALVPHARAPAGATRTFGRVFAVAIGLPEAFWNPVFITSDTAEAGDVAEAVAWIRSLGLPASAQVRGDLSDRFDPQLRALGLEPDPRAVPGMALHPIPAAPAPPAELRLEVVHAKTFDDWHRGISYGERLQNTYRSTLLEDDAFRLVVGFLGDEPVTGAAAILTGKVAGIYAVGTAPHARRRGFGRAATWAALEAGIAAGCRVAILQATKMSERLYAEMGFVEVCCYLEYAPTDGG